MMVNPFGTEIPNVIQLNALIYHLKEENQKQAHLLWILCEKYGKQLIPIVDLHRANDGKKYLVAQWNDLNNCLELSSEEFNT
jgi:hypothetical protein